jgi:hypothetical protein
MTVQQYGRTGFMISWVRLASIEDMKTHLHGGFHIMSHCAMS